MDWSEFVQREIAGRNQQEIADRCGVHQTTISRWARGKGGNPTLETAMAFARACEASPVEALVVLDALRADDLDTIVKLKPSARALSDEELVAEMLRRLKVKTPRTAPK